MADWSIAGTGSLGGSAWLGAGAASTSADTSTAQAMSGTN